MVGKVSIWILDSILISFYYLFWVIRLEYNIQVQYNKHYTIYNKFQHHNSGSKQSQISTMKSTDNVKLTHRGHSSQAPPFNQQSTNNLLKQLQLSLQDVQNIITKSKQSLGLNQTMDNNHRPLNQTSISGANNTIQDQLTYSLSLCTQSRLLKNQDVLDSSKLEASNLVIRKLLFQDSSEKKQAIQGEKYAIKNRPPTPKSVYAKKPSTTIVKNQAPKTEQKENKNQSQEKKIEIKEQWSEKQASQKSFHYEQLQEQYCIMINKKNKPNLQVKVTESKCEEQQQQQSRVENTEQRKNPYHQGIRQVKSIINQQNEQIQEIKPDKKPTNITDISNQLQRLSSNRPKLNQFMFNSEQLDNTCVKNQLENILIKNFNSRKSNPSVADQEVNRVNKVYEDFRLLNQAKRVVNVAPSCSQQFNTSKKRSIFLDSKNSKSPNAKADNSPSLPRTPQQIKKSQIQNSPGTTLEQENRKTKPTYIQKYLNLLQKNEKKMEKNEIKKSTNKNESQFASNKAAKTMQSPKYSHPSKSPNYKRKSIFQLQQHKKTVFETMNRSEFIEKMLQQCYVRRFLTEAELSKIYDEFCQKKIARFKWQQKVIEKIFTKIRQIDYLM